MVGLWFRRGRWKGRRRELAQKKRGISVRGWEENGRKGELGT